MGKTFDSDKSALPRVAVVGGGISGVAAAHFIHESRMFDVTLFEERRDLGGSSYCAYAKDGSLVDMAGRIFVRNSNFGQHIHQKLNVPLVRAIPNHRTLYHDLGGAEKDCYWFTLLNPRNGLHGFLMLLASVKAARLLVRGKLGDVTFRQYLESNRLFRWKGYDRAEFKLVGFFACILSMTYEQMLECPMEFVADFIRYYSGRRHTALNPDHFVTPTFRTRSHFQALSFGYRDQIRINTRVKKIVREVEPNPAIRVVLEDGSHMEFDKVVLATNADQALALLDDPTPEEKQHLSPWRYRESHVVLHDCFKSFKKLKKIGTYLVAYRKDQKGEVEYSATDMSWRQFGMRNDSFTTSTQNPNFDIPRKDVQASARLRTPIYTAECLKTQKTIGLLNGKKNTYYCGAYFGHGNHEDAFISSMLVAKALGVPNIEFYEPVEWAWFKND